MPDACMCYIYVNSLNRTATSAVICYNDQQQAVLPNLNSVVYALQAGYISRVGIVADNTSPEY